MASIFDWSKTAGNNDTSDSDINWQENQVPSTVNNSARQMMGRVAELLDDLGAVTSTTNLSDAYTLTANSAFTVLQDGLIVGFKASATNTGAATLNVNATGTKAIRRIGASADVAIEAGVIVSGQKYLAIYDSAANAAAGAWMLLGAVPETLPSGTKIMGTSGVEGGELLLAKPISGSTLAGDVSLDIAANLFRIFENDGTNRGASIDLTTCAASVGSVIYHSGNREIPAGTRMVFYQAAAPTGWTQVTGIDNRALRVTDGAGGGSGGVQGFTTVFGRTATDGHVLTEAQLASHLHSGNTGTESVGHFHGGGALETRNAAGGADLAALVPAGSGGAPFGLPNTGGISATHFHGFNTSAAGGNGAHSHNIDLRVTYLDVIVCSRN